MREPGAVAVQTNFIERFAQLCVVIRAVDVMTIEAGNAAAVHHALHEIVALHAIFVGGAVREVGEGEFAEIVVFELPVIAEIEPDMIADRPIVVMALDGIGERAAL